MKKIVQTAGRNALNEFAPQFTHFNKEYCFTEYHRFTDLLFAGSIQYDDDCHVK